jgi:hypothetical protein
VCVALTFLDDLDLDVLQTAGVVLECARCDDLCRETHLVLLLILPHVIEVDDVRMVESTEDDRLHLDPTPLTCG